LVHLSSLPKRYQKRDDETEEDYALRVKELKLQDAHRHYQTVLLSASAPTQEEAGASSSPMTTTTTTAHQEKLCEAMQQLRQAYEDLMYWDKAVDVEEKLLQQYTMIMEANTNNDGNEEIRKKVATSLVKLGDLHVEMGHHFVEARRYYKQAMEIYLQLHQPPPSPLKKGGESSSNLSNPPMHADMGQVLHSVAMTYARQEEFDKATTILNQAKEHFVYHGLSLPMNDDDHDDDDDDGDEDEEERNDNTPKDHQVHPGVFQVLEDHAWILRLTDRYEMALSVYQEAYSYAKELKVEAKSEFWNDMEMNMADCQLALGKTEQALYTYQGLLDKAVAQRSKAMETNDADGNPNDDEEAMSLESVMRHNIGHIHAKEVSFVNT
jgi:tetratricopeptide (TPR) repeat protein